MREFSVTIDRTVKQLSTITIKAENEDMARAAAMDIANDEDEWKGNGYYAKSDISIEEVPNEYIDRYGNPYDSEDENACWPAGGGLHKDCEFNADALYAYYVAEGREKIAEYLTAKGFAMIMLHPDEEIWKKGNTRVVFEDYDESGDMWGYMHTELI